MYNRFIILNKHIEQNKKMTMLMTAVDLGGFDFIFYSYKCCQCTRTSTNAICIIHVDYRIVTYNRHRTFTVSVISNFYDNTYAHRYHNV